MVSSTGDCFAGEGGVYSGNFSRKLRKIFWQYSAMECWRYQIWVISETPQKLT